MTVKLVLAAPGRRQRLCSYSTTFLKMTNRQRANGSSNFIRCLILDMLFITHAVRLCH